MMKLNLPEYAFKIKKVDGAKKQIFDSVRKKYVALLPEEWVRQNFIQFLVNEKGYPLALLSVEHSLSYNSMQKRGDIVVFGSDGFPKLIVECKAPEIKISQATFDQAARYNMTLKLPFMIITNGLNHYVCAIDHIKGEYTFLEEVPNYSDL